MKFAYLITAHEDTDVLHLLLKSLDDFNNDIFIHWDLKAQIPQNLNKYLTKSNLFILKERYDVRWGDISQVLAEYSLFRSSFEKGIYDYYHLISSSDMPIKTNKYIQTFFSKNNSKNLIGFASDNLKKRVLYKHINTRKQRKWTYLDYWLDLFYVRIQQLLGIQNKYLINVLIKKGPNWVSVTNSFVEILLKEKDWVIKTFSRTRNPDEYYKQVIAYKCGFENRSNAKFCTKCGNKLLI